MILSGMHERQKTPLYIHVIDGMHTVHIGEAASREKHVHAQVFPIPLPPFS